MALRFTVLASGSAGNVSLVEADGFGLLLDAGLGPRRLAARLTAAGASWQSVQAALISHTHSDHWNDRTLGHLLRRGVPVYCHDEHHRLLQAYSPAFARLRAANLVRRYEAGEELRLAPGLRCLPIRLRHDSGATFGFRLEGAADLFGHACALGYVSDLGCWDAALARALANVDVLALEFNHDVAMQLASGRPPVLIARVLGDDGHLSNVQAAELLREVLRLSQPGRVRHVVQLHLSRDCNHPTLAVAAARSGLAEHAAEVHTACQDRPGPSLYLGASANGRRRRPRSPRSGPARSPVRPCMQPWLPGLEG